MKLWRKSCARKHRRIKEINELGCVDIHAMAACKRHFSVLPVLKYFKYAPVPENHRLRLVMIANVDTS
jgi:hypothetical protein